MRKETDLDYLRKRETFRAYKTYGYSKRYFAEHGQM